MTKHGIHINIIRLNKQQKFFKAFAYAGKGIQTFFLYDRNGRVHLGASLAVVIAGIAFNIAAIEWLVLLLCIAMVIALEMVNAALEKLCDMVHKDLHPSIKIIKDISAGAVLWAAIISFVIGAFVFVPKIITLL